MTSGVSPGRRVQIITDQGGTCLRCGTTEDLTIDHIVPRSQGGSNQSDNLQVLCEPCNAAKGARFYDYRGGNRSQPGGVAQP